MATWLDYDKQDLAGSWGGSTPAASIDEKATSRLGRVFTLIDSAGGARAVRWDFGDGTTAEGAANTPVEHTYRAVDGANYVVVAALAVEGAEYVCARPVFIEPTPVLVDMVPDAVVNVGSPLQVGGRGFSPRCEVLIAGTPVPTTFMTANLLVARVTWQEPGEVAVAVRNTATKEESERLTLTLIKES